MCRYIYELSTETRTLAFCESPTGDFAFADARICWAKLILQSLLIVNRRVNTQPSRTYIYYYCAECVDWLVLN